MALVETDAVGQAALQCLYEGCSPLHWGGPDMVGCCNERGRQNVEQMAH